LQNPENQLYHYELVCSLSKTLKIR